MSDYKEQISKKRAELKDVFDNPALEGGKYDAEQKNAINGLNTELAELVDAANMAKSKAKNEKAMDQEVYASEEPQAPLQSIGDAFVKSAAYQNYKTDGVKGVDSTVNFSPKQYGEKATLGAGLTQSFAPEVLRQPGILESALRDPDAVIGLFDQIETDQNSFAYMEETTFTNAAAEQAEEATTAEATLDFTEQTAPIRKIGVFLPVTEELLADVSGIQGYVNSRLATMMKLRLDGQLLSGNGTAPNIEGILDAGKTNVDAIAYGSYSGELKQLGALYQAITNIRTGAFVEPDAIVMHPNDWYSVVTSVNDFAGTSSAGYASKNPLFVVGGGFGDAPQPRIWGIPVVPSTAISENTVLVGRFGGGEAAHVVMRQGIDLAVSDSHSDFFLKGKLAIRATMRVGLAVYRQQAFSKITAF
jgi:HK97 family phage major capsid protein